MTTSPVPPDPPVPDLQFDRVVAATPSASAGAGAVCAACQQSIATEYYDINGNTVCENCRAALEAAAETPRGITPLALAALFGFGAAIAGAAVYYAVIAIAHLEIGIIAVLCGYLVGYAVRKGAGGRGGRRFQVLAVLLTYVSVGLAYTPLAVQQVMKGVPDVLFLMVTLAVLALALPVLVIIGSGVSGVISLVILAVGMREAWRMTAAPRLNVQGPYRVAAPPAAPA